MYKQCNLKMKLDKEPLLLIVHCKQRKYLIAKYHLITYFCFLNQTNIIMCVKQTGIENF